MGVGDFDSRKLLIMRDGQYSAHGQRRDLHRERLGMVTTQLVERAIIPQIDPADQAELGRNLGALYCEPSRANMWPIIHISSHPRNRSASGSITV